MTPNNMYNRNDSLTRWQHRGEKRFCLLYWAEEKRAKNKCFLFSYPFNLAVQPQRMYDLDLVCLMIKRLQGQTEPVY